MASSICFDKHMLKGSFPCFGLNISDLISSGIRINIKSFSIEYVRKTIAKTLKAKINLSFN
jgi:hypothetical protein